MNVTQSSVSTGKHVEMLPGIVRTTLCWDEASMVCHFALRAGSRIPLHSHVAAQNGYVIRGKLRFLKEKGGIERGPGDGYLFASGEVHGLEVLEDSEIIECFTPMRPEYL